MQNVWNEESLTPPLIIQHAMQRIIVIIWKPNFKVSSKTNESEWVIAVQGKMLSACLISAQLEKYLGINEEYLPDISETLKVPGGKC